MSLLSEIRERCWLRENWFDYLGGTRKSIKDDGILSRFKKNLGVFGLEALEAENRLREAGEHLERLGLPLPRLDPALIAHSFASTA